MSYRVEPLGDHALDEFGCGNAELDRWLRLSAVSARGHGTRTYLMIDHEERVVGYFAVAPNLVDRDEAPRNFGRGSPRQIPAILLAKLALDESIHGQGLGSELLVFALATIIEAARSAGGRVVVVDAIDEEAVSFYEHHDFERMPDHPRRLVIKLSTVAKALGLAWP